MRISNKIIIVTGASAGVDPAAARLLSEQGVKAALAAHSRDK